MKRSDIPNVITLLRMVLVLPVVMALLDGRFGLALVLFTVAGVSDGVDGYIAKRYNYISRLGSILDPMADKLLLVSTFVTLGWLGLLPVWLVATVIARDGLILLGALSYHYLIGQYEMAPSLISKANTGVQIILGLAVVLSSGLVSLPGWLIDALVYAVLGTTVLSGIDYVWTWSSRALHARSGPYN